MHAAAARRGSALRRWAALLFVFPLWVLVVSYLVWSESEETGATGSPASTPP